MFENQKRQVVKWVIRNGKKVLLVVTVVVGLSGGSVVKVQGQIPAEATNFSEATAVAGGVASGGRSTFYTILPVGMVIGLSIWGWKKFKKVAS